MAAAPASGAAWVESMPASYEIDKQKRMVVTTAWGVCTVDDVLRFREQVLKDSDFDPSFSQLADFTAVTQFDVTAGEVRMLAGMNPFSPDSRRALVAESGVVFGLARMFEILRGLKGETHIRVFRSRSEALAWLLEKEEAA